MGMQLLIKFVKQAPIEIMEQKGNLWTGLVIKALHVKQANEQILAYEALKILAEISNLSTDLTKSFSSTHLVKIYESLANVTLSAQHAALDCVEKCLRLYAGASGPCRMLIEKFLLRFIDAADEQLSRKW